MKRDEHNIQAWIIRTAHMMRIPWIDLLYAIPNGGHRDIRVAAALKAEGVKAGVPDLHWPISRCGYNSLYLEVKTPHGRLSPNQKAMIARLEEAGNLVEVVRDVEHALNVLRQYQMGWLNYPRDECKSE